MYERLTAKDESGRNVICLDGIKWEFTERKTLKRMYGVVVDRLSEFEDIELSPEEIKEKLSGTILNGTYIDINTHYKATAELDKLKDTNSALEESFINSEMNLKALADELEQVKAERDAAVGDLHMACRNTPCNTGVCATKNCTGNKIPCEFTWRGIREQDCDISEYLESCEDCGFCENKEEVK